MLLRFKLITRECLLKAERALKVKKKKKKPSGGSGFTLEKMENDTPKKKKGSDHF